MLGGAAVTACVTCFALGAEPLAGLLGSAAIALLIPELHDDRHGAGPDLPAA